ncbi:hypothetical protein [Nocardia otitidiscaviarum]|nr:hypothetical protein [Nocardia otitidiscaviarum]
MRDVSVLEPSDQVEFDVPTTEVVEKASAFPEQDRAVRPRHPPGE